MLLGELDLIEDEIEVMLSQLYHVTSPVLPSREPGASGLIRKIVRMKG